MRITSRLRSYANSSRLFPLFYEQELDPCLGMMDSEGQIKVDPTKQALLKARFFGTGRENIEVRFGYWIQKGLRERPRLCSKGTPHDI